MMNDRFSAELRQHLLATADERPADGRLAAIVEGVAVTTQRHPLVTRLRWSRTRLDPFPSRAMRLGLIVAAVIVAVVGVGVFAVGQSGRTPFQGTWTSIDPEDGSEQTLVVGAGTRPTVHFEDEIATVGACVDDPIKLFTADGTGAITGNHLDTSFPNGGGCGSTTVEVDLGFAYDDGNDSLRDQDGVDWIRVRGARPADASPSTSPSLVTPKPSDTCVQFDEPTTYTAPAGSMSLSVSVPGTAKEPWLAEGKEFNLMRAACTDMAGQGYIEARELRRVYPDGCAGPSVGVGTTAEGIEAVTAATNLGVVKQSEVTLGGYKGSRFDILVPVGLDACRDHQIPVVDGLNPFDAGVSYALYLIDVDGKTLALALFGYKDWDPDVATAVDGILDSMQIDPSPAASMTPTPTPTEPSTSPAPTPHEGEATFTSAVNGFSMGVPKGWQTRAATEPWTGGPLDFDSPAADVIFDPATKDGLYLIVASHAFGDISGDAWRASVLAWTCAGDGGHEFWGWKVDGAHSEQFGPCNSGSIVQTDTRGYLFRLVSPRAEKLGLTDTWDSLKPMLETVDLRPEDAVAAAGAAKPLPPVRSRARV